MNETLDIWIGSDRREPYSYEVFRSSLTRLSSRPLHIRPVMQQALRHEGLYTRQHIIKDGQTWDVISGAPMSTDFAITRFLVPHLQMTGWCMFGEPDMVALADIAELFALADPKYAAMCVKHDYVSRATRKMDRQLQVNYARKNWSSLVLWNCDHPSNAKLTVEMVNTLPGRDLHAFCWLADEEIGALPIEWNYLAGEDMPKMRPKIVHHTGGTPETTHKAWMEEALRIRRLRPSEVA